MSTWTAAYVGACAGICIGSALLVGADLIRRWQSRGPFFDLPSTSEDRDA